MDSRKFNKLLRSIKEDGLALEEIYEVYFPKVVRHIRRRFNDLVSPEDMAQEAFVYLLSLEIKEDIKYPTAWLYKIIDNKIINTLKAQHGEIALSESIEDTFNFDSVILKADVIKALKQLDPLSQKILYMHLWEGYLLKDIAIELNMSYLSVRLRASRAYKLIEKYL